MLSAEDKQRIEEEERLRSDLRAELDPPKKDRGLLREFLSGDSLKWLATTILIPLAAFATTLGLQYCSEPNREGREDVTQLTGLLPALASSDQTQRCVALAVLREMGSIAKTGSALNETYEMISGEALADRNAGSPDVKTKGAKAAACLSPPSHAQSGGTPLPPSKPAPVSVAAAPPRKDEIVYLQIYHNDQLRAAQSLTSALQAAGIPVSQVIDDVGSDHGPGPISFAQTGTIDIRYYYQDDLPLAAGLANIVKQVSGQNPTLRDLSGRLQKASKGVLEIWYPCAEEKVPCVISED